MVYNIKKKEVHKSNAYNVDVLVIGGGCAGVAAGITAARRGLRTLLIENMNSLGGLMTNGYVTDRPGSSRGCARSFWTG
jgi:heterodisulfide reductase subunit A-like polyferredoxin